MFVDTIQINLLSGSGGSGSVSFSSKSSKTSPNGANGGNGGSIIFISDSGVFDYSNLKSKGSFKAENGGDASKNLQNGPNGKDMYLKIPIGTSIISDGELLAEIIDPPLPPFAPFGEVLLLLELKLTEPEPPLPDNRLI